MSLNSTPTEKFNGFFANYGKTQYGLIPYGVGMGRLSETINFLSLQFDSDELLNLAQARKLFYDLSNDMVNYMNADCELQSAMLEHPQSMKSIALGISFDRCLKLSPSQANDFIALVLTGQGKYFYFTFDPINEKYNEILSETVEEAKQRIKEEEDEKHN